MFTLPAHRRGFSTLLVALALAGAAAGGCDPASRLEFDVRVAGEESQVDHLTVSKARVAIAAVAARQGFSRPTYAVATTGEAHEYYELDELTDDRPPRRRQILMSVADPKAGLLNVTLVEFISWRRSPRLREIADDLYAALVQALGAERVVRRK
jgi:hypothetical protein